MAEVLPIHEPDLFQFALEKAARFLKAGHAVAMPTETVYGLAANALDPEAVDRVFKIKGRPSINPLIVHVAGMEMARSCAARWPEEATRLAAAFWPGPLTLVVPRSRDIPDVVTAGGPTVGLRWPRHPFAEALIRRCGFPLAAPSANRSTEISPTTAEHVRNGIGAQLEIIVDGGQTEVGLESTVIDVSVSPPRVLRPGMIQLTQLRRVLNDVIAGPGEDQITLRSPGLMRRHYAPKARLVVLSWNSPHELMQQLEPLGVPASAMHVLTREPLQTAVGFARVQQMPPTADAFARNFYAELHRSDQLGAKVVVVQAPPETPEWDAIHDRLRRAAEQS